MERVDNILFINTEHSNERTVFNFRTWWNYNTKKNTV